MNDMSEVRDLLKAARHAIDGGVDSRTPEYQALDDLERAVSLLTAIVANIKEPLA